MIKDEVKALVQARTATISTLLPSGQIQARVVWVDCDVNVDNAIVLEELQDS